MGPLRPDERALVVEESRLGEKYGRAIDRESAYEVLAKRAPKAEPQAATTNATRAPAKKRGGSSLAQTVGREVGRTVSRELVRGLMGVFKR